MKHYRKYLQKRRAGDIAFKAMKDNSKLCGAEINFWVFLMAREYDKTGEFPVAEMGWDEEHLVAYRALAEHGYFRTTTQLFMSYGETVDRIYHVPSAHPMAVSWFSDLFGRSHEAFARYPIAASLMIRKVARA